MPRSPLPRQTRADIWDQSGGICVYCGQQMHPILHFTVDHVHPVALGGGNEPSNLVAACRSCNITKGARLVAEAEPVQPPPIERLAKIDPPPDLLLESGMVISVRRVYTVAEVAEVLAVDPQTVRRWLRAGELAGAILGDKSGWRIAGGDLLAFWRARSNQTAPPDGSGNP